MPSNSTRAPGPMIVKVALVVTDPNVPSPPVMLIEECLSKTGHRLDVHPGLQLGHRCREPQRVDADTQHARLPACQLDGPQDGVRLDRWPNSVQTNSQPRIWRLGACPARS